MKILDRLKERIIQKLANALYPILYRRMRGQSHVRLKENGSIHESALIQCSFVSGNVRIGPHSKIVEGAHLSGNIDIGRYTTVNGPNTDMYASINQVHVGSFCSIARNVSIQEYNHNMRRISTYFFSANVFNEGLEHDIISKGNITIGNDVWIGTQCVILSGANIGHGAVIAANSVVSGDIPPYAIAAGSPATVIKYRFDEKTIDSLLQLQWWNWPIEKIARNHAFFKNENIAGLSLEEMKSYVDEH